MSNAHQFEFTWTPDLYKQMAPDLTPIEVSGNRIALLALLVVAILCVLVWAFTPTASDAGLAGEIQAFRRGLLFGAAIWVIGIAFLAVSSFGKTSDASSVELERTGPERIAVSPDGVEHRWGGGVFRADWSGLRDVIEAEHGLVLHFGRNVVVALPNEVFGPAQPRDGLVRDIEAWRTFG